MRRMEFTAKDLVRAAKRLGFARDRQTGSHAVYVRGTDRVVIPMHAGRAIKPKTLASILSDMGITVEQLREML